MAILHFAQYSAKPDTRRMSASF